MGSCVNEKLRGAVVELIRVHRFDEAQIIGNGGKVREAIGYPSTALAVLFKWELSSKHFRYALNEGELFTFEKFFGAFLAVEFI